MARRMCKLLTVCEVVANVDPTNVLYENWWNKAVQWRDKFHLGMN
jgi:hypothetical protein